MKWASMVAVGAPAGLRGGVPEINALQFLGLARGRINFLIEPVRTLAVNDSRNTNECRQETAFPAGAGPRPGAAPVLRFTTMIITLNRERRC